MKEIIEENASELSEKVAEVKVVSKFQASLLCNAVAGRTFESRNQLIAFFGLDVRVRQMGSFCNCGRNLSLGSLKQIQTEN